MKIFEGLQQYQAIKMESGKFVVHLSQGYSSPRHEVNGQQVTSTQVVVDDLNKVYRIVPESHTLVAWQDSKGVEVSKEEMNSHRAKWLEWEDVDGEMDFSGNVEMEVAYVKERAKYRDLKGVYQVQPETKEPIEITVVGVCEDTGSKFIETPFQYGAVSFNSTGVYKLHLSGVALEEWRKTVEQHPEQHWELPTHSHLKYAKVAGSYVFTDTGRPWIEKVVFKVYSSLEDARSQEASIRQYIRGRILMHLKPTKAGDVEIREFVAELQRIKGKVGALEVKQKCQTAKYSLVTKISEKIEQYIMEQK